VKAQARRSGAKNPQKRRDRVREWKAKNPEWAAALKLVSTRNRRARMAKVDGTHSVADIKSIFKAQNGRCAYCKACLKRKKRHVDHIVPICLGGLNDRRNLQITCDDCNMRKGSTPPLEFARQEGMLL
jgi:5-methylcytosine-specific restriction endonuclease McrA